MRGLRKLLVMAAFLVGITLPLGPQAQTTDAENDSSFLENLIQDALGGDGREVRVINLSGVLSSEASIGAVEILDDDGIWLRARDIVLDWRRIALLRGRLEVEALTIGSLEILRKPLPGPPPPPQLAADEEKQPFALPELPVSINVEQLAIGGVALDESVIGHAAVLSISGSARLSGGEGEVNLNLVRIDGLEGAITLAAGFENESRRLFVDLDVREEQGGLLASVSGMPGAPKLELTVKGDGPVDAFDAAIQLATDDIERLGGNVSLSQDGTTASPTLVVAADLSGDVADLFLPDYKAFFGRNIELSLLARQNAETGINVEKLDLTTQSFSLNGAVDLTPDFLPRKVDVTASLGSDLGLPVVLPLTGPPIVVSAADLSIQFDEATGQAFDVAVEASGISGTAGFLVDSVTLNSSGDIVIEDGTTLQSVAGDLAAEVAGLSFSDPALWDAAGDGLELSATLNWTAGNPLAISDLNLSSDDIVLAGEAEVDGLETRRISVTADITAQSGDLDRFSAISGQDLGGTVDVALKADYDTVSGAFDVDLDGTATDLSIGEENADRLLAGVADIAVSAARTSDGIVVDDLSIASPSIALDGSAALGTDGFPQQVALTAELADPEGEPVSLPIPGVPLTLDDLSIDLSYDQQANDAYTIDARINGVDYPSIGGAETVALKADGTLERGDGAMLLAEIMANLKAEVSGLALEDPALADAAGSDLALSGAVSFSPASGDASVSQLSLSSGDLQVTGDAQASGIGGDAISATADIELVSGDLDRFSAISGQSLGGNVDLAVKATYDVASGEFDADVTGATNDLSVGQQDADQLLAGRADVALSASRDDQGIVVESISIRAPKIDVGGSAALASDFFPRQVDIAARISDPDGNPVALPVPGVPIELGDLALDLKYDEATSKDFVVKADVRDLNHGDLGSVETVKLAATGTFERDADATIAEIGAKLSAEIQGILTTDPALQDALADGATLTADATFNPSEGVAEVAGLALVSGDARVTGEASVAGIGGDAMSGSAKIELDTGELSRFAGVAGQPLAGRLTAETDATFDLGNSHFDVVLTGKGNDLAIGNPNVDQLVRGETTLNVDASRDENGMRVDTAQLRSAEVTVDASGALQDGGGKIEISGELRELSILVPGLSGPVKLKAVVASQNDVVSVNGNVVGPAGIGADVSGDIVKPDGTVDVKATGSVPLSLANRALSPRSIEGTAEFDIALKGPPALESVTGSISIGGARFSDPVTRLALDPIVANINMANSEANVDVNATLSTGGTITVNGPISFASGIPANLEIALNQLNPIDPRLYDILINGNVTVNGPLAGGAVIAGDINIDRAEFQIPTGLGGAGSVPEVTHVNETALSLETRERAGLIKEVEETSASGEGGGPAYPLDIRISAPRQIFIRGRGLDVEMGGAFQISGSTASLITAGELRLIRGRMSLLAQRLEFEQAELSLQGDLMPDIRMVAVSDNGDIVAKIVIEGPVNDPEIELTSDPELPEDEVLAQLFFGKPISELTPLELLQLANAVNDLTGGGGGLFGAIRGGLGVDDLSVGTDSDGNTEVSAGKYLTENIYTDVTVKSDGTSEVELNYEITKDILAKGSFDNKGNTGIGFSFERDY